MIKRFHLQTALLLLLLSSSTSVLAQSKFITAYTDDFSGFHYEFGVGQYDNTYLLQTGYSSIGSVKVPKGMRIRLYLQDNFQGQSVTLLEDGRIGYLTALGFSDIRNRISMIVDEAPATDPAMEGPVVIISRDNFSGSFQTLKPGDYQVNDLSIGNDQLSSLRIPKGLKVTLYENQGFEGKSIELIKDTPAEILRTKGFDDAASSIMVELVQEPAPAATTTPTQTPVVPAVVPVIVTPVVVAATPQPVPDKPATQYAMLYPRDFSSEPMLLKKGTYQLKETLKMNPTDPFALRIPWGLRITLYDNESYAGRPGKKVSYITDTDNNEIATNGMSGTLSWIVVDAAPIPELKATLYGLNFSGPSGSLGLGDYTFSQLGIGNDELSSIAIPRGIRVTLFEHFDFKGRTAVLMEDTDEDFLNKNEFNNITSAIRIEKVLSEELQVTMYRDNFSGTARSFYPGRYDAFDLKDEEDRLSSIRIPQGMKVTLFENDNFTGKSLVLTRDAGGDYIMSNRFNDIVSSLIVEDAFVPVVSAPTPAVVVVPVVVTTPVTAPAVVVTPEIVSAPATIVVDCAMSEKQYKNAVDAVKGQSFSDGKLSTAELATKNKCLTIEQIRGIATLLTWDETKMGFVKYAYEASNEKGEYYTLSNLFSFSSSVDEFSKFLKSK